MKCDVGQCERAAVAKGYCLMHYRRVQKHGDPLINKRLRDPAVGTVCHVKQCDEPIFQVTWCRVHYNWQRRHGVNALRVFSKVCEACGSSENLHLDHNHNCCATHSTDRYWKTCGECLRGILCRECNMALGALHDDVDRIANLLSYVKRHDG